MDSEEKVPKRENDGEDMAIKLIRGFVVGTNNKRAGSSTPPPAWRLKFSQVPPQGGAVATVDYNEFLTNSGEAAVSARKLCANLWEIERFRPLGMKRGLRKPRSDHRETVGDEASDVEPPCNGPPVDCQPLSTGSLRRQIGATLGPEHRLVQRNGRSMKPVSPASCNSSAEVVAYKPALTRATSLDLKPSSYGFKNSAELLKLLNRIWSLEEQHASNTSLVKDLKRELDQCRREIKALQWGKQTNCHREDIGLMGRDDESKLVRKRKEQERLKAVIESIRDELEAEKKLRRQSESLRLKLAREHCEAKSCLAKALKELNRERKARVLLENLCDEFAKGVKDYEEEFRILKSKASAVERENPDRLIVHISEAWLDERLQMMRLGEDHADDDSGKNSVVEKLGLDIETFLNAKRSHGSSKEKEKKKKKLHSRWRSLESYPLNGDGHEEYCSESDSRSLHLEKSLMSRRCEKGGSLKEYVAKSSGRCPEKKTRRDNQLLLLQERKCVDESHHGLNLDQVLDKIARNQSVSSEGDKIHPETTNLMKEGDPCGPLNLERSATCLKLPPNVKENTLQAKLMEARLESRLSRS